MSSLLLSSRRGDIFKSNLKISLALLSFYVLKTKGCSNFSSTSTSASISISRSCNTKVDGFQDVYIALGSNIGDRIMALHEALKELRNIGTLKCTSFLYETPPMYLNDQPTFLNAACHLVTNLSPNDLLSKLKVIEDKIGRIKTVRNGPRLIDLDIILYGNNEIKTPDLQIPHLRLHERAFVLRPLCDLNPYLLHPVLKQTMLELLSNLPEGDLKAMRKVIPIRGDSIRKKSLKISKNEGSDTSNLMSVGNDCIICGILNITPDSFSDGGKFLDMNSAIDQALSMELEGAKLIDIGGESTRPGATPVTVEEEINRVVPIIKALRESGLKCAISIDTRNSEVAREAIEAGADIINDVTGGKHDPNMLSLAASLGVPIILMHMRGTPITMLDDKNTKYEDVVLDVATELNHQLDKADQCGIPRWMQIVDPGIGFAKKDKENVILLKPTNLKKLKQLLGDRPMMVGLSRKRFLKNIITHNTRINDDDNNLRDFATIGACLTAIEGDTDILRVHNVKAINSAITVFKKLSN